jgi:hypothetical protein
MKGFEDDGIRFEIECLIIVDSKRSIVIINENGERLAVLIRLPIVAYLQKTIFDIIMDKSDLLK